MTVRVDRTEGHFRVQSALVRLVRDLGGAATVGDYLGCSDKTVRRVLNGEARFDHRELVGLIVIERDDLGTRSLANVFADLAAGDAGDPSAIRAHLLHALKLLSATNARGLHALDDGGLNSSEIAQTRESALAAIAGLEQYVRDCDAALLRAQRKC